MDSVAVFSDLEKRRSAIVDFSASLVRIPSVNPPGDESAVADFVRDAFERLGLHCTVVQSAPKRINLVFSGEPPDRCDLVFNAHMDTAPIADRSSWKFDPFGGVVQDGKLFGRGSNDDKGGIATIYGAVLALKSLGADLSSLQVHIVADEEGGSNLGTKYLVQQGYAKAKAAIVCEGSVFAGKAFVRPCFRGSCSFTLETRGKSAHVSMPSAGKNAILSMATLLTELKYVKLDFRHHRYLPDPDVTLGTTIKGGEATSIIPSFCEATCNIRTVPGMTKESLLRSIQSTIDTLRTKDPGFDAAVKITSWSEPVDVAFNAKLVSIIQELGEPVLGYSPEIKGGYGSNDAAVYNQAGVPAVAFGPADIELGRAHGVDEWQDIASLISFSKIYALAALRLCDQGT